MTAPLTVLAAVAARIDALGLGVVAHTTRPPEGARMPYAIVQDNLPTTQLPASAPRSGRMLVATELQVDLLQHEEGPDAGAGRPNIEDAMLPDLLTAGLLGRFPNQAGSPVRIYGIRLISGPLRLPSPRANNQARHTIHIAVDRVLPTGRP